MPPNLPPMRHLPTLTEVVKPAKVESLPADAPLPASPTTAAAAAPQVSVDDLMALMAPVLEAELRKSAQNVLDAHMATALPQATQALRAALLDALNVPGRLK